LKILVVGATSALGAVLLPVLSEFADVTTAGRKDCDLHLDLADSADAIGWSDHFETVIELAAHFGGETDEAMLEAEDVNALGTLKLCQAAVRANASHFVLISSMFVCLPETSEYFGIYPLSKRHAEEVARLYCHERSLPLAIVRPSQIYGDSERFRIHQPFLYAMVDNAERSQDIAIYGTRDPRRNYIHADDVAAVIARVVKRRVEGTYACLNPADVTYSQIANAAFLAFGARNAVRFCEDKPDIPDNTFDQDDALYRKIDWVPQISIEDGMNRLARYRQMGDR
jgi:nucleoside-diphosphate-sugar epimerase